MIVALLLVVLLAISLLYCLGFASLALRQNLEATPLPSNASPSEEGVGLTPAPSPMEAVPQPTPSP
jgi:hypothetical protein